MKKLSLLILLAFLFSGCRNTHSACDPAITLRNRLLQSQQCSFLADITASYSDRQYKFSLECECDTQGNVRFRVIEPESIRDITGYIDHEGGHLTFDQVILAFPLLADGYLSPVSTPWLFIKTLRGGYILSCGEDSAGTRMTINDSYAEKALQLDIWADNGLTPFYAEIYWDGTRILSMQIQNFTYV